MDEATKASTVSSAFRKAISSSSSNIEAIDELTSRLSLAILAHRNEPLRHSVVTVSDNHTNNNELEMPSPAASMTSRPSTQNLGGNTTKPKSPKTTGEKVHKGKKRVLSEKSKDKNTDLESKANVEVNAKICKETKEGRSKSVAPERRGKRAASLRGAEEGQAVKRVRSTSTI